MRAQQLSRGYFRSNEQHQETKASPIPVPLNGEDPPPFRRRVKTTGGNTDDPSTAQTEPNYQTLFTECECRIVRTLSARNARAESLHRMRSDEQNDREGRVCVCALRDTFQLTDT